MGTYLPKPAGIPAGMGKSFNLDPRSWRLWVRHFAVMVFSSIPVGLQKPATGIVPTVFAKLLNGLLLWLQCNDTVGWPYGL